MKESVRRRNKSIIIIFFILIILIVFCIIYPKFSPYNSINIGNGDIISVTVSQIGINGKKTTDPEILNLWADFLKNAKCKPKRVFIFGGKPNWVKISMSDGNTYYFERWPYFKRGIYIYQIDNPQMAQNLFNMVLDDSQSVVEPYRN